MGSASRSSSGGWTIERHRKTAGRGDRASPHGLRLFFVYGEAGSVMRSLESFYPTTSLFVFFKYFAGIGASSFQVMFIGRSPSCLT